MLERANDVPAGYGYLATAGWFAAGAIVTAIFSGSLVALTAKADFIDVIVVGMVVPSFTWIVQLTAAALMLTGNKRRYYLGDLGRVCAIGSIALMPAAVVNLTSQNPPGWPSVANVVLSVALMGAVLHRRAALHGISPAWPASWLLTISLNMALFLLVSRTWW